jgi:hypothetical protein
MLLNQTNSGKACPRITDKLSEIIKNRQKNRMSLMIDINVNAFDLAMILDRIEVLENQIKQFMYLAKEIAYKVE